VVGRLAAAVRKVWGRGRHCEALKDGLWKICAIVDVGGGRAAVAASL